MASNKYLKREREREREREKTIALLGPFIEGLYTNHIPQSNYCLVKVVVLLGEWGPKGLRGVS